MARWEKKRGLEESTVNGVIYKDITGKCMKKLMYKETKKQNLGNGRNMNGKMEKKRS